MSGKDANQFQFAHAGRESKLTVLNAVMSDFSYSNHAHEEIALGVTQKGMQEFSCKGSRFLSPPGGIILFNPGDVHNGNPGSSESLKYTMLYVDAGEFGSLMTSAAGRKGTGYRGKETSFVDKVLESLILRMSGLVSRPEVPALERERCLYAMARRLAVRADIYLPDAWTDTKDALLLRARDFIHDNIGADLSVDDLSRVAGMSKYHFIRLFRSQFGLTPHQYILNLRINRAKQALAVGAPPSDIAQELGFFDVSHLNRHFKRACGLTPGHYRQQLTR